MGEAKRRKLTAPVTVKNITGDTITVRETGDPLAFVRGQQGTVPCNGCTECCYHVGVDVNPDTEPPERLQHLDLERRPDGWFLRKRADGACVHLGPNGCTVYEHRPNACRNYDCRVFSLTGVLDSYGNSLKATAAPSRRVMHRRPQNECY